MPKADVKQVEFAILPPNSPACASLCRGQPHYVPRRLKMVGEPLPQKLANIRADTLAIVRAAILGNKALVFGLSKS
jgi:hypothetical protein